MDNANEAHGFLTNGREWVCRAYASRSNAIRWQYYEFGHNDANKSNFKSLADAVKYARTRGVREVIYEGAA